MTATYLGSVTIGGSMPGAAAIGVAGAAGINTILPDLLAQLASLLSWSPSPISLTVQISTLEAMITALNAQIAIGLPPPSLSSQLAAIAAMIAALQGQVASLELQLALINEFQASLSSAGVHLVAFEGPLSSFGGDVDSRLSSVPGLGPLDACNAITLLTTVPATWAALASILKVAP